MNTKYGRLVDGRLEYAPKALADEGGVKVSPSEASYLAAGWKKLVDVRPEPEERMDVLLSSWTETDDTLTAVYKYVPHVAPAVPDGEDNPSAPAEKGKRVFSKLKIVAALKAADKWVLVRTWMEEMAYYDYYVAAQDFSEDNELFVAARAALQRYTGMTDEEVETLLAGCVAD